MRKTRKVVTIIGCILVMAIIIIVLFNCYSISNVRDFSLDTYADKIEKFSRSDIVEKIESPQDAIIAAKKLWTEIYGSSINYSGPYRVYYDEMNQAWLVTGSFLLISSSGPYALITSDGDVLAIWNEKF